MARGKRQALEPRALGLQSCLVSLSRGPLIYKGEEVR